MDGKDGHGLKLEKVTAMPAENHQKNYYYRYCSLMKIVLDPLHNSTHAFFLDNTNKVMFQYRIDLKQQYPRDTIFPL